MKNKKDVFLTQEEALARLRISRSTLFRFKRDGKITATKLGKKNLYSESEIERFLASLPESQPASGPNTTVSEDKSGAETHINAYYWITRIPKPPS